jgi:ribosomal protein S18 acetylase RimI-like enzyme
MFVAEMDGQVVGTVTLRTWEMGSEDSEVITRAFYHTLGWWGATRSIFVLSLLNHRIGKREGFITDVAVLDGYQRRGIATMILNQAEERARQLHKQFLGLYVSHTNHAAITLYEKLGYTRSSTHHSWVTWLCFRQYAWLYMRKDLV